MASDYALVCHPLTPCAAIMRIDASVLVTPLRQLQVSYRVCGPSAGVSLPAAGKAHRADKLWQHSCCELFMGAAGAAAYCEFNFSPSSAWAAYEFTAYRQGKKALQLSSDPVIAVGRGASEWTLQATVAQDDLPVERQAGAAKLALAVVIEESDGRLSYWALRHPAGKPDFHHAEGFLTGIL